MDIEARFSEAEAREGRYVQGSNLPGKIQHFLQPSKTDLLACCVVYPLQVQFAHCPMQSLEQPHNVGVILPILP